MRLFAAIVPPRVVLNELDSLVRSVTPGAPVAPRPTRTPEVRPASTDGLHVGPRRGLLGRRTREAAGPDRGTATSAVAPQTDQLTRLPVARMHLPITTFGHLTRSDSELMASALRDAAANWSRPTLRLAGGTALEWPGDKSVWARLEGDLDGLQVIAQGVPKVAQRLSLFVDRRQFRPWLSVGTINDLTTAPYLEELVAALERFEGMTWTQETVSLMKGQPGGGPNEPFEELEPMPLSGS